MLISIGIIAWNEADVLPSTLESLFAQSLFQKMDCEVLVIANGCTDDTVAVAERALAGRGRVCQVTERGKPNAWNEYIHRLSDPSAEFFISMDTDIRFQTPDTLWNMYRALLDNPHADVAVDNPIKDIALKPHKSLREKLSLAASRLTKAAPGQLCGQLYCIRAAVARQIYLPRVINSCDDGFIKIMVCTKRLTQTTDPNLIIVAPDAAHVFEAYVSASDILRNQKRQMISQTILHVLVDKHLPKLSLAERVRLGEELRARDHQDPQWAAKLVAEHLREVRFFWRLFPNLLTLRFQRLANLRGWARVTHLPVALVGWSVSMVAAWLAWRTLKSGHQTFWPKARRGEALLPPKPLTTP